MKKLSKAKLINILLISAIVLMLSICFVPWAGSIGSQSRFPGISAPHNAEYIVGTANPRLTNEIVASAAGQSIVTAVDMDGIRTLIDVTSSTEQYINTVADGTTPMVITSTTLVENLNVDLLDGHDWESPGDIGGDTPGAGIFTTSVSNYTILNDSDIAGSAITAAQAKNGVIIFVDSGAFDKELPPAAAGLAVRVKAETAADTVILDSGAGDIINLIDGTAIAAGNAIDLAAQGGAYVYMVAKDDTNWWVMAQVGAIVDGGAD